MDNDFKEEIKIPIGLDDAVLKGFEKGRQQKMNLKSKRIKRAASAAGIALVSAAAITISSPKLALAVSNIFSYFQGSGNYFKVGNYKPDTLNKISQTIDSASYKKDGVTVSIKKVSLDDNIVAVVFDVKSDKLKNRKYADLRGINLKLNGKNANEYENSFKKISETESLMMIEAPTPSLSTDKNIKLDAKIEVIYFNENRDVDKDYVIGPWNLSTTVSKTSTNKIYNCNSTIKYPNAELTIQKLVISPLCNLLYTKTNYTNKNVNDIVYYNEHYAIRDDKGKYLTYTHEDGGATDYISTDRYKILNDLTNTKYIDILKTSGGDPVGIKQMRNSSDYINAKDFEEDSNESYIDLLNTIGNENNKKKEKLTRKATAAELKEGYCLNRVDYYVNTDRKSFYTLDQLIGKKIKISNTDIVTIANVQYLDNNKCKFTLQNHDPVDMVLFDSDMHDIYYHGESPNADEVRDISIEDPNQGLQSIILSGVDKNKKYNIGLPMNTDTKVDESSKVRIYLNK